MELKDFLIALQDFGMAENLFEIMKIKDLEKSCCVKSNVEVIDFDKTKEIFCEKQSLDSLKSADALKFLFDEERIDFIEMKGMKNYIKFQYDETGDPKNQIDEKVDTFDLYSKYYDSYHVLYQIVKSKKFLFKDKIDYLKKTDVNFIILTDIEEEESPVEFIAASLDFLSETSINISKIFQILDIKIDTEDFPKIHKMNKPILKNCSLIDLYYN